MLKVPKFVFFIEESLLEEYLSTGTTLYLFGDAFLEHLLKHLATTESTINGHTKVSCSCLYFILYSFFSPLPFRC